MTVLGSAALSRSVQVRIDAGVMIVTIDNPPVNAASHAVRAGLRDALNAAKNDPAVTAIVITGQGKIFVGGADITEFGKPAAEPVLPDVIAAIERSTKPVIAAINGAALGGGLEIALGCHGRIAAPGASFAFPEVKLGIIPGAGGTQRLPRLTGVSMAIDLIGSGRTIRAAEALSVGVIDAVAEDPVAFALSGLRSDGGLAIRRTDGLEIRHESPETVASAVDKVLSRSRGLPAVTEIIRLVTSSATGSLEYCLADERKTFLRLRDSEEAVALRYVFFAEREALKIEKLKSVAALKVECIGVVGAGLMGSGIAVSCLEAGYKVVCVEQTDMAAQAGLERIVGMLDRSFKAGRFDEAGLTERLSRLTVTGDMAAIAAADLVVEAVFDDLDVKTVLFRRLDDVVRPDAILATNTSYLDPDAIAAATRHPERVAGLHFFSPAHIMRLVEVVDCSRTSPETLATVIAVARKLGKLPVVTGVTEGFIGNSVFSAYRREAEFLLEDGASPEEIDRAMEDYGFAMGPFAVFDMAGLEIAWARRKRQAATRNPADRYVEIPDLLCEAGRLGQKVGKGWYRYDGGKRAADPEVGTLIAAARARKDIVPRRIDAKEIVSRLLHAMSVEAQRLLAAGIAMRASDIDLVMINGYGFPAHRGGPVYAATRTA